MCKKILLRIKIIKQFKCCCITVKGLWVTCGVVVVNSFYNQTYFKYITNELHHMPINNRMRDNLQPISSIVLISTAVSRDYACLMSPNKDETGRRLSRILLLMVKWWSSLLVIDGAKHLNFVEDGRNKYRLRLLNTKNWSYLFRLFRIQIIYCILNENKSAKKV